MGHLSARLCSLCSRLVELTLCTLISLGAYNQCGRFNKVSQVWWNLSLVAIVAKSVSVRENYTGRYLWKSAHLLLFIVQALVCGTRTTALLQSLSSYMISSWAVWLSPEKTYRNIRPWSQLSYWQADCKTELEEWLKQETDGIYPSGTLIFLTGYTQEQRHTTVDRSYSTKTNGWGGGWHMVICSGVQLQLQQN